MGVTARDMEERQRRTLQMAEKLVESTMAGRDASHDAAHAFRVRDLALSLAMEEGLDNHSLEIVEKANSLTFMVFARWKLLLYFTILGITNIASRDLVEDTSIVENFLNEEGLEESKRHKILGIIKGMGIARCFTYGGSKNRILHDPKIPPRQNLSKENYINKSENQTTINHFHEKLFKLKDMMKTEAGRKRAEKRHIFMVDFIEEFYEEWNGRT
ncbi:hypothetical protein MA16_Dca013310 [Dendrobium catenatum]|uniref:Uncharacterized protein n=1 Tax=Dendrobium catenatum TaxID=906689 RepID=A0A2I0WDI4_9ASPA|nr:hypothetical protein MA16_Dca013310 [Dendrobium catenatum]